MSLLLSALAFHSILPKGRAKPIFSSPPPRSHATRYTNRLEDPLMAGDAGGDRLRLLCSHGGRFLPCGSDGALRYVGGETRVLALPRAATFRELAARLAEMAGGAEVRGVRHRLADEAFEDVLVSVTCDEELAHMIDEYDRLRATRPAASFRVFVSTSNSGGVQRRRLSTGLPPRPPAPAMRRVQSDQALAARAHLHRRLAASPELMRRVQSAQDLGGASRPPPSFYRRRREQCGCSCHRRDLCGPAPPPARPMQQLPYVPKNIKTGRRPGVQEASPPEVSAAKAKETGRAVYFDAATEKARSRDAETAMEHRRAFWEFE
ncbi:hypothetical protein ACP70R_025213 [Stipagrostis hirtigluma subsp. patula]